MLKPYKKYRSLFALLGASFISVLGDTLAMLAIPWFVLQTTGSATQTGITAFFSISPIVLATFFGGAIVDRVGYKRVSIVADLLSGLTIALIPLLHLTIGLEFWQLLLLVFLGNLLDAPATTARKALLPNLAEEADMSLERATALSDGLYRATRMIGAPVGGMLIVAFGAVNVLWLDAISFLISALMMAYLVTITTPPQTDTEATNYLDSLQAGLRFIKQDPFIITITITVMITNMLDSALSLVILPIYVEQIYGAGQGAVQLGWLVGITGGSAFLGTILMGIYGKQAPRRLLFVSSFVIISLRWFVLALFPSFWYLFGTLAILSLAIGPINPIISTILYERIPDTMRARVLGTTTAGVYIAMPLGALLAGFLIEMVDLRFSLLLFGTIYLLTTLHLAINPALQNMKTPQQATLAATSE